MEGDYYSPSQAARILSRSGRSISERRIRQMLQAGELEGEQAETGRWKIPQSVVHELLEQRREQEQLRSGPESPLEASESVRELMARVEALARDLGRSEARLELTEQAESSLRDALDAERARAEQERRRADTERERAEKLEAELAEARRPWWSRWFGGG